MKKNILSNHLIYLLDKNKNSLKEITINDRKCFTLGHLFMEQTGDEITYYGKLNDDMTVNKVFFDSKN